MEYNIEIPTHNNAVSTLRNLTKLHPDNQHLTENIKKFNDLYDEVKIRFDTDPHFYQKEDYLKLIDLIKKINTRATEEALVPEDLKTVNNESLVGEGNIETPDCELSVKYSFSLVDGKYIFTEGDYKDSQEAIVPLKAEFEETTNTIIL